MTKPLRITILQGAFLPVPPLRGGAIEKMWFLLGQEFARSGHTVHQISRAFDGLPDVEIISGVHHRRIKGFDTPGNGLVLKAMDFVYSWKVSKIIPPSDILVTNTFWLPFLAGVHQKGKVMVDVQRMPKGQLKLYRRACCLRANSTPVLEAIRIEVPLAKGHSALIPNPLTFQPPRVVVSAKESLILYAGRVHPEKGLELLLQAASSLPVGWKIQIVGPSDIAAGGGGELYLKQLKLLAGTAPVEFLGPIYDSERLEDLYRRAAVFVYPSIAEKGETFGLAPLEAMAYGCTPIVSNLECFKDFVFDGVNGLIFDHRAPDRVEQLRVILHELIRRDSLRSEMSREAFKVTASHSPVQIAKAFIDEFYSMLNGGVPEVPG